MIKLTILSFLITFINPPAGLEQKACDYFFSEIYEIEYADYKVIEFDNLTETAKYWGIVHGCKNWNEKTKGQIISTTPDKLIQVAANVTEIKLKRIKENSARLKIRVSSKIKIGENYFVLIRAYRKLRFVEYFFIEIDKEGKIIETCKQSEII